MKCCNYSKLDLIRKGQLIEGGGNETNEFYASEIGAILEDEDMELYGEDDIVVDGPEPESTLAPESDTPSAAAKKPAKGKPAVPRTPTAPTPMTPEQITTGRAKIMRLIQQRTPPDIPTLVRACIDDGMTASDLAALTGLSCHMIARCKTGAVTLTVAGRFQELFAFPRNPVAQEEE